MHSRKNIIPLLLFFCALLWFPGMDVTAQNFFTMSREEREAYLAKINAQSNENWLRMINLVHVHLPDSLPPPANDPRRPRDTFQKEGSPNWYDKDGNLYTQTAWGTWNNYDEAKANPFPRLPDPLTFPDGRRVSSPNQWWRERRAQLVKAFDNEIFGNVPSAVPEVHWSVLSAKDTTVGKMAVVTKELLGRVDSAVDTNIHVEIQATLTTPANAKGPVPIVLEFGFLLPPGFHFPGMPAPHGPTWQEQVLHEGWGYVEYVPTSVQPDNAAGLTEGIIGLVNKGQPRNPGDWGALRAWAWGAGRVMDYLETDRAVDAKRVALEGLSRYGKAVLLTMAYDQRFAIVLVGSSGKGGAALYRRNFGESMGNICSSGEYHWFGGTFMRFVLCPDSLSVDAHELIALCAPRPVFISCGSPMVEGRWVDDRGQFEAEVAAGPVYALLGERGLGTIVMPPIGTSLLDGTLAFRQHEGAHTVGPNWPYFLQFARRWFASSSGSVPR
jgi:hypothetical protein